MAEFAAVELGLDRMSIEVTGEFDLADEERALDLVHRLADVSDGLLFDLSDCSFIDSTGLRTLLRAHNLTQDRGIPYAIAGSGPAVKRVLDVTGLRSSLPVFEDRREAVRSLGVD